MNATLQTHVTRTLHDEHMATLRLIERLDALLGRHGPGSIPDIAEAGTAALLRDFARAVALEIGPHFDFEEVYLFPRLLDAGEREMVSLLSEEHGRIRPVALRLAELARLGGEAGFATPQWAEFSAAGADLSESLASHVQKEEMGMLPILDDLLDAETDGMLALALAELR